MNRNEIVLGLVALAFAAILLVNKVVDRPPAPVAQPAVPGQIPPKCDGPCGHCRPESPRPFAVVCPCCRNRLDVTPPTTGEIGEVAATKGTGE